jgi:repressor LexA
MNRAPGSYAGLTVKQADLLSMLRRAEADNITPSFEEMRYALGLASKSGVARLVTALEERGYIRRQYGLARSIVCLDGRPDHRLGDLKTGELVEELTARGFRFYGMSGEMAA